MTVGIDLDMHIHYTSVHSHTCAYTYAYPCTYPWKILFEIFFTDYIKFHSIYISLLRYFCCFKKYIYLMCMCAEYVSYVDAVPREARRGLEVTSSCESP